MTGASRRGNRFGSVLLLASIILLMTAAVGLVYSRSPSEPIAPRKTSAGAVGPGASDRLDTYLREKRDVIEAMGKHADSEAVFAEIAAIWQGDGDPASARTLRAIATAFPDHVLGLYSLRRHLRDPGPAEADVQPFCWRVIVEYPDSRIARMAFDHVVTSAPDDAEAAYARVLREAAHTPVAAFALTRRGDALADAGDHHGAISNWLEAWIIDPGAGAALSNKLVASWLAVGDWLPPAMLGGEYLGDPALNPLKSRLRTRHDTQASNPDPVRNALESVGDALAGSDLNSLCSVLRDLRAAWPPESMPDAERAEHALALFVLGGSVDRTFSVSLADSLLLEHEFHAHRRAFLELALPGLAIIEPDLRALYRLRIANRLIEDVDVQGALAVLDGAWEESGLTRAWRERLVRRYGDMVVSERGQRPEAARAYAKFCDLYPEDSEPIRVQAGTLLMRAGAKDAAIAQFERLSATSPKPDYQALAWYMIGMCHADTANHALAEESLARVAELYPGTAYAPKALAHMASLAIAQGASDRAKDYLAEIRERYSDWEEAPRYAAMEAGLNRE